MRNVMALYLCSTMLSAQAQLVNGSFEQNGAASLAGWEWTCGTPVLHAGAAPGSGLFAATKEPGQFQGCFPSYFFQRIPSAQDGQLVTLSGWVRCDSTPPCLGAWMGLGRVNGGVFELEEQVGATDPTWQWLQITDTVQLGAGDTAIVVLDAGSIGGPVQPSSGWFDGLELGLALGMGVASPLEIAHFPDPTTDVLYVACGRARVERINVQDLGGRIVLSLSNLTSDIARIDVHALSPGTYLATVQTDQGTGAFRFVHP